jgi:starch-binding outer membrane protein, SusD/RagB family
MRTKYIYSILLVFGLASCYEEYMNPSATSEEQATATVEGLISLSNGLQSKYTTGRLSPVYNAIAGAGLSTKGLKVLNPGNTDEVQLEGGGNSVATSNAIVRNLWEQDNLVKANSELILENLDVATDAGIRSGLHGSAAIFKALALGNLAMFWEQAPIQVEQNASFQTRTALLSEAIHILEEAEAVVSATPVSAAFYNKAVTGVDIYNTLNALIARYALMFGDYDKALAAAAKVNLSVKSFFQFNETNRNPIFETALSNVNVFQPRDLAMGLPASLTPVEEDKRIDFFFVSRTPDGAGIYRGKSFFTSNSSAIPVYLPGEILLIQAEAYARKDDLANALSKLNDVVTKKPEEDTWLIGADLPELDGLTKDEILTEIYRNRAIELFMSGLTLEDNRRFDRPAPTISNPSLGERTRNFYPYPDTERDNNVNTPNNPSI